MARRNNIEKTFIFFFRDGQKTSGIGSTYFEAFINAGGRQTRDLWFFEQNEEVAAKLTWDATTKNWVHKS